MDISEFLNCEEEYVFNWEGHQFNGRRFRPYSYCSEPSIEFKDLDSGEVVSFAISAETLKGFERVDA